jgi:deazaflavin-dependent oxidoreductase (nitroreductase family)
MSNDFTPDPVRLDPPIVAALDRGHVIDITTTGRRSGEPRRIEIVFFNFDGRLYISGMPSARTRGWIHNLEADPALTVHLKGDDPHADLPATARVITDEAERRTIMPRVAAVWRRTDVEGMVTSSPLIEVTVPGYRE